MGSKLKNVIKAIYKILKNERAQLSMREKKS